MKTIPLIQRRWSELPQQHVIVDDVDYERVSKFPWRFVGNGSPGRYDGPKLIRLTHFLLGLGDSERGKRVYAVNGNILDCRRANLTFRHMRYKQKGPANTIASRRLLIKPELTDEYSMRKTADMI